MNKDESLALYAKGKEAWNIWANEMLAKKAKLEGSGEWQINVFSKEGLNSATKDWVAQASVDFSGHVFEVVDVDFSNFIFPYCANYNSAEFSGEAKFNEATFGDNVRFINATFCRATEFMYTTFCGDAEFNRATFSGYAEFSKTKFNGEAGFNSAKFSSEAKFNGAIFSREVWFEKIIFSGIVGFNDITFSHDVNFSNSEFNGCAWFSKTKFSGEAGFSKANFGGEAWFDYIEFSGNAGFNDATFRGNASFYDSIFSDSAGFVNAIFNDAAGFSQAKFSGNVEFDCAKFSGIVRFEQTLFEGFTSFQKATFENESSFVAINSKKTVTFRGAKFFFVPNFSQAHFIEAPQLDNLDFSKVLSHNQSKLDGNLSSNWRSLKRLAIQGHDHERELFFFAEEIKSRRGIQDKALPNPLNYWNNKPIWPGGTRYLLGYFYQYVSDFGHAVIKPILLLLFLGVLFQNLYLNYPIEDKGTSAHDDVIDLVSCERSEAALYLSVRSALPFLPASNYSEKINRSYECLYGKDSEGEANMPNVAVFFSIAQTILSTTLIFLLLLALRNNFRIK